MTGETETRLTGSVSAQVTEDIEITVTEEFGAPVAELAATPKIQHAVPDRGRAGRCSSSSPRCHKATRSGSASAANWSSCTFRWWSTSHAGSVTAVSGWTT